MHPSEESRPLSGLGVRLFVTWGSGLLWGISLLLVIFIWLKWAFSGFLFGEPPPSSLLLLGLGLGLVTTVPGPMLLSAFLARNWRRGVVIGLLAVLTGVMGFLLAWLAGGSVTSWVGSIHVFGSQRLLLQNIADAVSFQLPPILGAAGAIMTILLVGTQKFPRRGLGLGVGLAIGLGLSVAGNLVFGSVLGSDGLPLSIHTPPLVWVSAIYFPELLAGRSGRKGFLVWVVLVLTSFGLTFGMVSILDRLFG